MEVISLNSSYAVDDMFNDPNLPTSTIGTVDSSSTMFDYFSD